MCQVVVSLLKMTYNELLEQLSKDDRIAVWTCNDCVRYCGFGGRDEMNALADRLEADGYQVVHRELVGVSCNRMLVRKRMTDAATKQAMQDATVIIPLVCEEGCETVKFVFKKHRVIDTTETVGLGVYSEQTGMRLNWPLEHTGMEPSIDGIPLEEVAQARGLHAGPLVPPRRGSAATVAALLADLQSDSAETRRKAAVALAKTGDSSAVAPLIAALMDPSEDVRWAAAMALGQVGDSSAVEPLVTRLGDSSDDVRWAAAMSLGNLGHPASVPALAEALSDKHEGVRVVAAKALGDIADEGAIAPLIAGLSDAHLGVRFGCAEALGRIGPAALPAVTEQLSAQSSETRRAAAAALGHIGDTSARPELESLLGTDTDPSVRSAAAEALGRLGDCAAVPALIAALADPDARIRAAAAGALGELHDPRVPALVALLGDQSEDVEVRWQAARSLGAIGAPEASQVLLEALKDDSEELRSAAAAALGRIGGAEVVEALHRVADDDADEFVREAARITLRRIGAIKR